MLRVLPLANRRRGGPRDFHGVGDVCEDEAVDVEAAWSHWEPTIGVAVGLTALHIAC